MKFQTVYSDKLDSGIDFPDVGRTRSEFKKSCDINHILARLKKTGLAPFLSGGFYDDVSNRLDFRESLDFVNRVCDDFAVLPADIRSRFDNDPEKFLAFYDDDQNLDELVKLGLKAAPLVQKPPAASVPADPPPADNPVKENS